MRTCVRSVGDVRRGPRTVVQAAAELGLSPHTVRAWIATGRMEHHRLGRAIRISSAEIERMLDESRVGRSRRR
jgi:excisionase family DNA binding protein